MASKSGSVDPSRYQDELFDLYSIPAFDKGDSEVVEGREIGSSKQIVHPGDVLLSKIVPHIRRAWVVKREQGHRIIASGEWIVFRSDRFNPRYLRHVLTSDSFHAQFMNTVAGVGGSLVRARPAFAAKIKIPLPPLEEQKRIAEVLDKAEELRTKRRAALAQLDSLTQSIFLEMFGDPIENERRWDEVQVRDFVAGFESGKSLVADDEDSQESPYRVLKVSAVTSLRFRPDESKALPSDYIPPHSHVVQKGDLLFSRANTADLIGATALVDEVTENIVLPDKLWRFVWHTPRNANQSFVRFLFQHPKFRHEIGKRATGTSGSMKNISQEKVLGITCALPPMELQEKFERRVAAVEKLKATQRASLAELDTLFASVQHRAFRGDL